LKAGFEVKFTADSGESPVENLEVVKQVELFRCAEAKEEAVRLADQGNFAGAQKVLNDQIKKMSCLVQVADDLDLAEELRELGQSLYYMSEPYYDKEIRKQMTYNVYSRKRGRKIK